MKLTSKAKKFLTILFVLTVGIGGFYAYSNGLIGHRGQPAQQQFTQQSVAPMQVQQPSNFVPSQDSLQSILQNRVIRVSVENPSQPIYNDENGIVTGFNYEFMQLLAGQQEFTANGPITVDMKNHEVNTYEAVTQQLLLTNNGAPVVDIAMDGITRKDQDPPGVVYSNPYITDFGYALIVQQGSSIRSMNDLNGKTIGILQGDPDVKAYVSRHFPNSQVVEVSDSDSHFIDKSIDEHNVDAFVYDYPFAVASIKGTDLKFAITKLDGSNFSYKIGVRATDQNLLFRLNSAIGRVMQTPQYLSLLRKYFVSDQVITTAASNGERTYVVKGGDTLNTIAFSQLGSGGRYVEIQRRNNLPNPNLILIGQHLVIPAR